MGSEAWPSFTQATADMIWPGRAIAALKAVLVDERLLHGMQLSVLRQPFDGGDVVALDGDSERQAREDALSVHMDGARAALALIAAFFASREREMLP